jgi:uncharacterized OB-fold protein
MTTEEKQDVQSAEPYPSADAWVEEDGRVHLVGSHCPECGKYAFPAANYCDKCGNSEGIESAKLSNVGKLYSFSEVHVAPKQLTTPYVLGYVDLPEDVRVLGQVVHSAAELQVDQPVETILGITRHLEDGRPVLSYKFRKTGEGTSNA